ncbi:hypothetical protein RhiXN_10244 [Rhizoctonia solani]|uniref:Uncharacterized protein n=1 Tax=Rhizoctonia solani TaxID=456999 RepID=A0A8H8P2A8_9AGAM|nr:uncharacterized protein RhiXN_10244 [Rhizoctonia solani]QRW23920.1 hypothetical protein RhiXN_10244 [Rhizoctonia solani]
MGQYVRIAVNFPLGTLHLVTILAVLNARSRETPDLPVFEEYEFGAAGYKAELNNGMSKVNIEGSLRIGNPSIKIPPRILRREPAITVLVQQETHIIGISETNSDDRNSTLRHHEDSDDTEFHDKIRIDANGNRAFGSVVALLKDTFTPLVTRLGNTKHLSFLVGHFLPTRASALYFSTTTAMVFNLNLTFGAAYVGVILAAFVYGIATLQAYTYWLERRRDSTLQRFYVMLLWSLDTFKLICICHMEYFYGIKNHGNPSALARSTW